MTKERIPGIQFTTGVGLAKFPHLINVDPSDEYGGDYTVKLLLDEDSDDAKALVKALEDARENFRAPMAERLDMTVEELQKKEENWPVSIDTDQEGNPTGRIAVICKSKGSYKRDGKTIERPCPTFYDAASPPNKIADPEAQFGPTLPYNSKIRLSLSIAPYYRAKRGIGYGVTPYITAVQVIEVATTGPATAADCGFEGIEGGFTAGSAPAVSAPAEDVPF